MNKTMKKMLCAVVMLLTLCTTLAWAEEAVQGILDKILVVYNMNQKTKDNTTYYPLHVYAGIDSLAYEEVGFEMRAESTDLKSEKSKSTKVVYTSMNVTDHNGEVKTYAASDLGGAYMFGQEMLFAAGKWYNKDTTVYVTPYAIRKDGTKLVGKELTLSDAIIKQVNPASALFKEVDVEVEDPEETPDVEIGNLIASGSTAVTPSEDGKVSGDGILIDATDASAEVPAGVSLEEGATELTLSIAALDESASNVEIGETEELAVFDVNIKGVSEENNVPILVTVDGMATNGLNHGNIKLYHVEKDGTKEMTKVDSVAELNAHNQFAYDATEGTLTMSLASFSEVSVVADTVNAWNGTYDEKLNGSGTQADPYIISNADELAGLSNLVSGNFTNEGVDKTKDYGSAYYKLNADINFGGEKSSHVFYPIGYRKVGGTGGNGSDKVETWYTYGGAFSGTFDGAGHTISNIYQNTWSMDGNYDKGYWDEAMGLFGYVNGGTVKNLTMNNFQSDGEFTPTGCVAAYAVNSTFENIALVDCNPRVYNTGNGGIVGIGGNTSDTEDKKLTFNNITIDNTNKISALWGSWDVACGGLVGMFRGAGHVYMNNCHVAAQIDVFNDVCGNYQYYWYRYAGMLVGTNKNMVTDEKGYTVPETSKFHAEDCTVHFGEWNNYYYCELVANSLASYTHDHQFSRLTEVDSIDVQNMTITVSGQTTAIPTSGRCNYVVVNGDPATENATCYHFVDGKVHNHEDEGTEIVNGVEVLKEDNQHIYLPFNQLFTGYGWGVKHIPVYNGEDYAFKGVTILDREVADSVVKFVGKEVEPITTGETLTIGELFSEKAGAGVAIQSGNVQVSVSPVGDDSTVSGVYTANTDDWTKGNLTFDGIGAATISITDYYFCKTTTISVTVAKPVAVEKFKAKENLTFEHDFDGNLEKTVGDIFEAVEGIEIDSTQVVVNIENGNCTYTANETDWTAGTLVFTDAGSATITITDNDNCIETTATVTISEPAPIQKFATTGVQSFDANGTAIKVGTLFTAVEGAEINSEKVIVTVKGVEASIKLDTTDWTQGTIAFLGTGEVIVTITDNKYCILEETTLSIKAVDKFDIVFENTEDYLYRVGNQNTVALGSLFKAIDDDVEINSEKVYVSVKNLIDESAKYTIEDDENTDNWTLRKIKFPTEGVVEISIWEGQNELQTLNLEIVNGYNVTQQSELKNRSESNVLLNDITCKTLYLDGKATLYGNGFTMDCRNSPTNGTGSFSENYIIALTDAHLDNVEIIGAVYTEYGAQAKDNYNRALVVSKGKSTITNCYLSNTASPVRLLEGSLSIKGSTIKGGNFSNVDIRTGHLVVEDVTTINQALGNDNSNVVGLGIAVYYENVDKALTSVTVKGTLNQYNHISEDANFAHEYANTLKNVMFATKAVVYNNGQKKWVNTGIVSMASGMADKIYIPDSLGYSFAEADLGGQTGCVYSMVPDENSIVATPLEYTTKGQGVIKPNPVFDYKTKNYVAKTEDSNDYCYEENGKVLISMDAGDTFEWDPWILTTTKYGNSLDYTVSMGGKTYSKGEKISFNTSSENDIEVVYSYRDPYNYDKDAESFDVDYTESVKIQVSVIKPTTQHATFTFADTNTQTEKITINSSNKTYISATGVSARDKEWGYITVNGTKIFYPITEAQMKKNTMGTEVQVYYYVFEDAVTITDYADGGTGGAVLYNSSTTTMPSNLTVVNGMEAKYTDINSACVDVSKLTKDGPSGEVWDFSASTTVSGTTIYNDYLAHSSPSKLAIKSGTRDYDAITVAQFSYTDNAGATYYYFVGYFMPNQVSSGGGSCITGDTMIMLADGSYKRMDELQADELIKVWDFEKGSYSVAPMAILLNHGLEDNTLITLEFSDGSVTKAVNSHGYFNADSNSMVMIDGGNANDYVGQRFVKFDESGYKTVTLENCVVERKQIEAYTIVSAYHYNFITDGFLSMTPSLKGLHFEVGDNLKYNEEKMQKLIAEHGIYTYEDFAEYVTEEQYIAFNGAYLKASVARGLLTFEEILELIASYVNPAE